MLGKVNKMSENTCCVISYKKCTLPKHSNYNECILHCSKEDAMNDYHKPWKEVDLFNKKLFEYILDSILEKEVFNKSVVSAYLQGHRLTNGSIEEKVKDITIVFNHIAFPVGGDKWGYTPLLQRLGKIHFNYCKFYVPWIELFKVEVFFQNCEFYNDWYLKDYSILENQSNVIYQVCTFLKSVSASGSENEESDGEDEEETKRKKRPSLTQIQFSDCTFEDDLTFEYIGIKSSLFNNSDEVESSIKYLKIYHSSIKKRFILNQYTIESVYMKSSTFKDKFEFKNNVVDELEIDNCNFKGLADFFGSCFDKFNMHKSIFDDFTGFEECTFGIDDELERKDVAKFEYVTFLNKINFRYAIFKNGLDLSHANFTQEPNFLYAEIDSVHTTRETFRSIKHSLDSVGNHLDANKYFVLEMKSYKKELQGEANFNQEKFVFWFNEKVSNFGQDYVRPIILLILSASIFASLFYAYTNNFLYRIAPEYNEYIQSASNFFNGWAHGYLPFSKFFVTGMESLSLFFYLVNLILLWQIVVAVKRHTKR